VDPSRQSYHVGEALAFVGTGLEAIDLPSEVLFGGTRGRAVVDTECDRASVRGHGRSNIEAGRNLGAGHAVATAEVPRPTDDRRSSGGPTLLHSEVMYR